MFDASTGFTVPVEGVREPSSALDCLEVYWLASFDQCTNALIGRLGLFLGLKFRGGGQDGDALFVDVGHVRVLRRRLRSRESVGPARLRRCRSRAELLRLGACG